MNWSFLRAPRCPPQTRGPRNAGALTSPPRDKFRGRCALPGGSLKSRDPGTLTGEGMGAAPHPSQPPALGAPSLRRLGSLGKHPPHRWGPLGCGEPPASKFPLGGDEVPGPAREGQLRGQGGSGGSSLGPSKAALDLWGAGSVSANRVGFNSVCADFGEGGRRVGHPRRRSVG